MTKKKQLYTRLASYTLYAMFAVLVSCKKEADPVVTNEEVSYVNFYNAAEALVVQQDLRNGNMLYINDSTMTDYGSLKYPSFFAGNTDKRVYPQDASNLGSPVIPPGAGYDPVIWMPIQKGTYKFIYTSMNKNYLKELLYPLEGKGSRTCFYLAENPESDESYSIVAVTEEAAPRDGKVRLRVVHLGTDAGKLSLKRIDKNGQATELGLPQNISFGSYSAYTSLDTAGASQTGKLILLRIFQNKPLGTSELMTVAVPALPNTAFTLLVQGFASSASRRILTGRNSSGGPVYRTVTVPANIRAHLRRVQ